MKTLYLAIMVGITAIVVLVILYELAQNSTKNAEFGCKDPEQEQLQYDNDRLKLRQEIEKIVLDNPRIKQMIDDSYCEFMADASLYTENGTYKTININLNNTKELSTTINLTSRTVVHYEVSGLTRTG